MARTGLDREEVWLSEDTPSDLQEEVFKLMLRRALAKSPQGLYVRKEDSELMTKLADRYGLASGEE